MSRHLMEWKLFIDKFIKKELKLLNKTRKDNKNDEE